MPFSGHVSLTVLEGVQCAFYQELLAVNTKGDIAPEKAAGSALSGERAGEGITRGASAVELGSVGTRLVCALDVDDLLHT
jgi:hypothetical protein